MTTRNINDKLSKVLKLFLLPNYNVVSTTYLDLLLSHLTNSKTEVDQHDLLKKWISEALDTWSKGDKPCQAVSVFTLKLIGLISRDENDFDDLSTQDVLSKLYITFGLQKDDLPASMKMAYTSMLVDIISHKTGRKWVINSGIWNDIVKYAQLNPTMYVTRESHKFLYTLLFEESQNKKFCKEIIMAIVTPLLNNKLKNDLQGVEFADILQDQHRSICTTFDLITSIYENILFRNMDLTIPDMFEELADLTERTKAFIDAWISTRLFKHIQTLWVLICFYKMKKGLTHKGDILDEDGWENYRTSFCGMQLSLINKKNIIDTVKSNKLVLTYWKKLQELRPFNMPYEHKFEHQNIALMITPMSALMNRGLMKNDFGEMFIDKLFHVTSQPVQRVCYLLKDVMTKEKLNSEKICKASIEMLLEIIDVMDRSVAVITFQSMCYTLKNYMPANRSCSDSASANQGQQERVRTFTTQTIFDGDPIVDNPLLLSTLLHGLAVMTEKFQFKWPDCLETICVLTLAQGILNHPGALPNLCVKALQLCKLAIQNFMPPNLALLVESDSNMNDIGTTLYKRLHDPNWEVRDSVLEVLTTIATISENKYPAFQSFLLVHKFLPVAVNIFMTDGESYVRASALKFISNTIKINNLWDEELLNLNLPEKTIKLYRDESEAIVRREAVTLIKELYVFRKWDKSITEEIKVTMAEAVVLDLHWEVKINALEFWRYFIKLQFEDQGMLDGCFPNVTFSKENRKIVSLNECEIKKRLNKALDNMANENCLGVLISSLKDESDFEVSKSSASIISELKIILLKYKIDEPEPENNIMLKDFPIIDTKYVKSQIKPEIINEKILEEIVNANDENLLSSIYENSLNMDDDKCDNNIKNDKIHEITSVTREKFLSVIINTDIDAYIEERRRWLKDYTISFDSVLEDIITVYDQKGTNNSMDCY